MFKSHTPKWVTNLPNDSMNKELLMQLIGVSKKPLGTPREINFVIMDFPTKGYAENAVVQIENSGWHSTINPDPENQDRYHLEATKPNYSITEALFDDEAFMARIADLYKATYDGWYAQVV